MYGCDNPRDIDRQDEYMNVYLPMTIEKNNILQHVPLIYNDVNFLELEGLNFSKDTTFVLGAYCAGTNFTSQDVSVDFSLANDILLSLQSKPVPQAAYQLLPESYYTVNSWNQSITKGETNCYMNIELKLTQLPAGSHFILPVKVDKVSKYNIDPEKSFILLGISKPSK